MEKVTFAQAARPLGIHPNTLKNWQRSGRLSSAEKQLVKGVATWLVDPAEVAAVALQHVSTPDNTRQPSPDRPDIAGGQPRQSEPDNPTTLIQPNTTTTGNNIDQNIMLWRDSLVAPLTAQLERQFNRIEELARENVNLIRDKEELAGRVRELEDRLIAREAVQEPPQAVEVQIPAVGLETPGAPKQAGMLASWWSRTFGNRGKG
jgi:hypothetical protein